MVKYLASHLIAGKTTVSVFCKRTIALTILMNWVLAGSSFGQQWTTIPTGPSTSEYAKTIEGILAGRAIGYAYAITKEGKLENAEGIGHSRKSQDGDVEMSEHTRIAVMSVSKTITAVSVLQLIEQINGIDIYSPIGKFLPKDWKRGTGFSKNGGLTFRDLLTHRSGILQTIKETNKAQCVFQDGGNEDLGEPKCDGLNPNEWDGLKELVELGIHQEIAQTGGTYYAPYKYKNANYALFRILLPNMWQTVNKKIYEGKPITEIASSYLFAAYVRQHVFEPADVKNAVCYSTEGDKRPMYYDGRYWYATGSQSSGSAGSCYHGLGPKGWYLSAIDLAKLMVHMRYGELISANYPESPEKQILSPENRDLMDQEKLGWSKNSEDGMYWHGGTYLSGEFSANKVLVPFPNVVFSVVDDARREARSCVMKFPHGIEATLVVNSSIASQQFGYFNGGEQSGYYGSACTVLKNAYEQAS